MNPDVERYGKLVLAAFWLLFIYAAGFSEWVAADDDAFLRAADTSSYLNGTDDAQGAG